MRDTDTISRQGGDEFLLALTDIDNLDTVSHVATKVLDKLAAPFQIEGHELAASLSMGVAVWPDDGQTFDALLQRRYRDVPQAKAAGRKIHRFYTAEMNAQALENLQPRTALHRALANQEFVLHYQPQVDWSTGVWLASRPFALAAWLGRAAGARVLCSRR
ncbi:MAG: diguanylate cyclase [Rhodoferax sp.]|nr:diguanylate cyclase [Rhodoferax sp.]